MFLPVCLIGKLNASASNNSELKECFDWKTKPNLKILWPTLAAGTLGIGSQIDLEPDIVECRNDGPCLPGALGITVASGLCQETRRVLCRKTRWSVPCVDVLVWLLLATLMARISPFHNYVHSDRNSLKRWTPALRHTVGRTAWPARTLCLSVI